MSDDSWNWFDTLPGDVQDEWNAKEVGLQQLRAEVERLRAEVATMRPIVEAVGRAIPDNGVEALIFGLGDRCFLPSGVVNVSDLCRSARSVTKQPS